MQKIGLLFSSLLQVIQRRQALVWRWATLVTVTYFLAKAANLLIAYRYLPLEAPPRKIVNETASALPKEVNTQIIISRNLFDSEAQNRIRANRGGSQTVVPSQLPYELVGTLVFQNSRFSTALIRDKNNKQAAYYGIGEQLSSARIHKIERYRVVLENGSRLESLDLKDAASRLAALSPVPSAKPTADAAEFQSVGDNRYVIPQSVVDDVLNNFNVVLTQARMIPNITNDGKTDGFKVFQIRDGSIYQKLQMKDNDIIKRVNGVELDTFEKATGLFTALRNEKSISIDLVRGGQRINYTYDIR